MTPFADAKYPPQAFRSCLGILNLERSSGAERLEGLEDEREQPQLRFPRHADVRGSHYYN